MVVINANDYYAFGSQMVGRSFAESNAIYRYGFNGKENDNEVKGTGNQQDYGMRIYDPRMGRFLSVDPITTKYPELSPYQYASNSPIKFKDLDGLEAGPDEYVMLAEPPGTTKQQIAHARKVNLQIQFTVGAVKTVVNAVGSVLEIFGQMEYGHRIKPENQAAAFPLTHGQNFATLGVGFVASPIIAVGEVINHPNDAFKWGELAGTAFLYSSAFKKGVVGKSLERLSFAENFYKKVGGNARDVNGIDLSKPVSEIPLDHNTKLYQWTIDGKLGDYFSLDPKAKELGVPQMPDGTPAYFDRVTKQMRPRTLVEIDLPAGKTIRGLKTTASNVPAWDGSVGTNKGGSTQVYTPEVKTAKPTVKPVN